MHAFEQFCIVLYVTCTCALESISFGLNLRTHCDNIPPPLPPPQPPAPPPPQLPPPQTNIPHSFPQIAKNIAENIPDQTRSGATLKGTWQIKYN